VVVKEPGITSAGGFWTLRTIYRQITNNNWIN
jgi:hypothetical protein